MAWPPAYSAAFIGSGVTSIKWGTDQIFGGTGPFSPGTYPGTNPNSLDGSYWVKSMRPMDVFESIYIENGTGIRSTRIGLIQGREWELTVVDDTSLGPPTYNTAVTLIDPLSGAEFTGHVIDNSGNEARKQEGERVFRVVFDTNIEGLGFIPLRIAP